MSVPTFDPRRLRDAFGCFATGVTIVTAMDREGRPAGLTANSFTSVSLEPPLLLFCLDRRSQSLPAFEGCETFAVNVLHAGQEALSARFGRRDPARFEGVDWAPGATGAPVLNDAMAVFEARRRDVHDGGDHLILVGEVLAFRADDAFDPLVFFQGRYRSVHVPE